MRLEIDARLRERIPGVVFGCATINGVQVSERDEGLWRQVEALCERQGAAFSLEQLTGTPQIAAVRNLQRSFGFDPTRYRPSSEALLRRVLKGQGLHQVNSAVDVNNLCSLEYLLPMCIYDLRNVRGQIRVRVGEPGEAYPGIGRQTFVIENKVIIADDTGVMGSTVSDSERTKVTTVTSDIFLAIYAPAGSSQHTIEQYASL
ncbi:MAG: hypothetical protein J2P36_38220, partial [Ktedonobacteraceae bacterium]|nr:hypothetical protein [Ktedonobacteraceae bacterium]